MVPALPKTMVNFSFRLVDYSLEFALDKAAHILEFFVARRVGGEIFLRQPYGAQGKTKEAIA